MTTFFTSIVDAVFRPSMAALAISTAIAIVSLDTSPHSVSQRTIDLSQLGCSGLLNAVCSIRVF